MNVLIVNGPNINFLGIREKAIYGVVDYESMNKRLFDKALKLSINLTVFQSNHEGEIIDELQRAYFNKIDGIIINPGAYSHYSYAIFDAIKSINIPTIEVHLTNIYNRDEFRKTSVTAVACEGVVSGFGILSYELALEAIISNVKKLNK